MDFGVKNSILGLRTLYWALQRYAGVRSMSYIGLEGNTNTVHGLGTLYWRKEIKSGIRAGACTVVARQVGDPRMRY